MPSEFSQINQDRRINRQSYLFSSDDPVKGFVSLPSAFSQQGLFGSSDASERFILNPGKKVISPVASDKGLVGFCVMIGPLP